MGKEHQGWAFLLPTVTPEDAKSHFPDHVSCKVCVPGSQSSGMLVISVSARCAPDAKHSHGFCLLSASRSCEV